MTQNREQLLGDIKQAVDYADKISVTMGNAPFDENKHYSRIANHILTLIEQRYTLTEKAK